jgi:hypothetical protein
MGVSRQGMMPVSRCHNCTPGDARVHWSLGWRGVQIVKEPESLTAVIEQLMKSVIC